MFAISSVKSVTDTESSDRCRTQVGKDYLLCDYNRDGDSYRSPWTNAYDPPLDDGAMPSERLRRLEVDANAAFDQYREMYFEGGVSSVYLWDLVSLSRLPSTS